MPKFDPGKWAEDEVRKVLEDYNNRFADFAYHRYPDSRSAQNLIAAQPADFLVSWDRPLHLEVKETAEKNRIPKDKVRQMPMLKKFRRAGIPPYLLIYRSLYSDWYIFYPHEDLWTTPLMKSYPWTTKESWPTASHALSHLLQHHKETT